MHHAGLQELKAKKEKSKKCLLHDKEVLMSTQQTVLAVSLGCSKGSRT